MAHIPKRASQHGIYLSGYETIPTTLKPGQTQLHRQDLYSSEAKPLEETYIAQDNFKQSVYAKTIATKTLPEDYADPAKPMRPLDVDANGGHSGTAHWRSEYNSTVNLESIAGAKYHRQHGPPGCSINPPSCVSQPGEPSSYKEDFGAYGSEPRSRSTPGDATIGPKSFKSVLTVGTSKGTHHVPGYQGFLPTNTSQPQVAAVEQGENLRSVDKTNITHIYLRNIPGYAGTIPENTRNDRGGRHPSDLTTQGMDYQTPMTASLKVGSGLL